MYIYGFGSIALFSKICQKSRIPQKIFHIQTQVGRKKNILSRSARDTPVKRRQKPEMKPNLRTPMKLNKLRKMTTTSPLSSRKTGITEKMMSTPPRISRSLKSCKEPGQYVV